MSAKGKIATTLGGRLQELQGKLAELPSERAARWSALSSQLRSQDPIHHERAMVDTDLAQVLSTRMHLAAAMQHMCAPKVSNGSEIHWCDTRATSYDEALLSALDDVLLHAENKVDGLSVNVCTDDCNHSCYGRPYGRIMVSMGLEDLDTLIPSHRVGVFIKELFEPDERMSDDWYHDVSSAGTERHAELKTVERLKGTYVAATCLWRRLNGKKEYLDSLLLNARLWSRRSARDWYTQKPIACLNVGSSRPEIPVDPTSDCQQDLLGLAGRSAATARNPMPIEPYHDSVRSGSCLQIWPATECGLVVDVIADAPFCMSGSAVGVSNFDLSQVPTYSLTSSVPPAAVFSV